MTVYCIYLPPMGSPEPPKEAFKLVPDKKSPWALIVPVIWLLYHRLWLELLAYVVVTIAIVLLFYWRQHLAISYLSVLPGLYLLLEGQELVRAKLERQGWQFAGIVEAGNKQDAELKFLAQGKSEISSPADIKSNWATMRPKPAPTHFGLFPE